MILGIADPLLITCLMAIASAGVSVPINTLYPYALDIIPDSKGRISALINGLRLILSSAGLWLVSHLYNDSFVPIGVWVVATMSAAIILTLVIMRDAKLQKVN